MKKSTLIGVVVILIVIIAGTAIFKGTGEEAYSLTEEEKLTAGGNEPGQVKDIDADTLEEFFSEVNDSVNQHLGE